MPSSTATAARLRLTGFRMRHPAGRNFGFVVLSLVGVSVVHRLTADSPPLATAAVLVVSTAAAMHARLALGRWQAAMQVVLSAAALSFLGAPPRLVGVVLICGLAGAELMAQCTRRASVLVAGTWTGIVAGLASLSGLLTAVPVPAGVALREALAAAAGGFVSAPVVLALGPVIEWLFGHTTRLTMSEWLSYEYPLLRELASSAPGTFQHSINVGVLADAAAGSIRADAFLARVGGLYHDVGKVRAPEYFIENQHGPNPHDQLQPSQSAEILRAHVVDGVELIHDYGMGERIADFVREHHGTATMRLFRDKADASGRIDSLHETYRYPGPRPRSRETAIVMIADQLEATARAEPPADEAACEHVVAQTVERIQRERELDDSGLTEADLTLIRPALSRALRAMHHRRLTYPPGSGSPKSGRFSLLPRSR